MSFELLTPQNIHHLSELGRVHAGFITHLSWSPDGELLAVAHGEQIAIWRGDFGGEPKAVLKGHTGPVKAVRFSPDSRSLASVSSDATLRLWDLAGAAAAGAACEFSSAVTSVDFNADGTLLVVGDAGGSLHWVEVRTQQVIEVSPAHRGEIEAVVASRQHDLLLSASRDRTVQVWQLSSRAPIQQLPHSDSVRDAALQPGAPTAATACRDGYLRLWALPGGTQQHEWMGHERGVDCVAFSPAAPLLASGGRDHLLKVWNAENGALLFESAAHHKPLLTLGFHPSGRFLVTGSGDNSVRLWGIP